MKTSNHAAKTVTTYTLPQKACQLRVSVRDVNGLFLSVTDIIESRNALSESKEWLINFNAFLLSLAADCSEALPLTSCEVNQLKLG
jgi:hypothetical protein